MQGTVIFQITYHYVSFVKNGAPGRSSHIFDEKVSLVTISVASYLGNSAKLGGKWDHSENKIVRALTYSKMVKIKPWAQNPPPLSPNLVKGVFQNRFWRNKNFVKNFLRLASDHPVVCRFWKKNQILILPTKLCEISL